MIVKHLISCSRCGADHRDVEFLRLERPFAPAEVAPLSWTWWAPCPANGQPILMVVTDDVVIDNAPPGDSKIEQLRAALAEALDQWEGWMAERSPRNVDPRVVELRRLLVT